MPSAWHVFTPGKAGNLQTALLGREHPLSQLVPDPSSRSLEGLGIFLNHGGLSPAHTSSHSFTPAHMRSDLLTLARTSSHQLTPAPTG